MIIYKQVIKIKIIFIFIFVTSFIGTIQAQDYDMSIGGRLGTYVGGTFTKYISENKVIEVVAGITREANQTDFVFGGYYKMHIEISPELATLNWYLGAGPLLFIEEDNGADKLIIAPSALVGMEYTLENAPVNFFLDVSPFIKVNTNSGNKFNLQANLGVRYILSGQNEY